MDDNFDDMDFSFDEFSLEETAITPPPIEKKEEVLPVVDIIKETSPIYSVRQIPTYFIKNAEDKITRFLYDVHTLIICKAYNSLNNPDFVCGMPPNIIHKDTLSVLCDNILCGIAKADELDNEIPDDYNVFSYMADLKTYMSSISNRINDTDLNRLTYTPKTKLLSGTAKKIVDNVISSNLAIPDVSIDYQKGKLIGMFLANTGYTLDMKVDPDGIISSISSFIDEINGFPGVSLPSIPPSGADIA